MYRKWVAIVVRESVIYLDSNRICTNGEVFDTIAIFILHRCGNTTPQEDNDWAMSFWPGWLANAAMISVGYKVS